MDLIASLKDIPIDWVLTPVNHKKAPLLKNWQNLQIDRAVLIKHLKDPYVRGYGLVLGEQSGGIIAIDCDGNRPHQEFEKILGTKIPKTIGFTSGKPGRAQYLFRISQSQWSKVKSKKVNIKLPDRVECLEFRWNGNQSVLPPSVHPETGRYRWINSPVDSEIAIFPKEAFKYLTNLINPIKVEAPKIVVIPKVYQYANSAPIPLEKCLAVAHRNAILYGAMKGSRNNIAVALANDLIGTASKLQQLGETFEGNPRNLFDEFCNRCSPSILSRRREEIWRWANGKVPVNPSINDDRAFQNCINSWKRRTLNPK